MFDVIGKRRWFYVALAGAHDPGPGLHPADAVHRRSGCSSRSTTPAARAGRSSSRTRRSRPSRSRRSSPPTASRPPPIRTGTRLHRDQDRADRPPAGAGRRRRPRRRAGAALARRERLARPRPARPRHRRGPSASAVAPTRLGASPSASPSAAPVGNTELPTDGKLGEMVTALEAELGPIEAQASLTTIGPVVSSDLINQALILIVVGSLGIVAWITYRFRDVKFGVTALVSLLHDVIVVVGAFAILGTFFHVEIDALFVTAMLTVIGFSRPRHDRRLRPDPREQGAPPRRAVRRDRQPLDPADVRALDHDQPDRRASRCSRCSCSAARRSATSSWPCSSASSSGRTRRSSWPARCSSTGSSGRTGATVASPRRARRGPAAPRPDAAGGRRSMTGRGAGERRVAS